MRFADAAKKLFLHAHSFFVHCLLSYFFDVRAAVYFFPLEVCLSVESPSEYDSFLFHQECFETQHRLFYRQ